uniref:DNA-directed DNA polymerase n=1 Tax=Angiostrongylus cantonensis TaxID=6313 RepID=A0A0K0D176_ANGCA
MKSKFHLILIPLYFLVANTCIWLAADNLIISEELVHKYKEYLDLAASFPFSFPKPLQWKCEIGWTRYTHSGDVEQVEYPKEDVFFFDVETCVQDGQLPTLAVALSAEAWYCWCSDRLVNHTHVPVVTRLEHMIPLGGMEKPRLVIGHNVGYDRARAREPYERRKSAIRFMDTMSMAIPMFGMADHQVVTYESDDSDFTLRNNDRTSEETKEAGARVLIEAARKVLDDLKPDENDGVKPDAWFFDVDWSFKNGSEYPE